MADVSIPRTVVATSDPVEIDQGFALIPHVVLRHEWDLTGGPMWDSTDMVLGTRLRTRPECEIHVGFAGPTYGMRMEVEGGIDGHHMALDVKLDQFQTGLLIGADVTFTLLIDAQRGMPHLVSHGWHSHFETRWTTLLSDVYTFRVDALAMAASVLRTLVELGIAGADTILALLPALSDTNGLWDSQTGIAHHDGARLTLHPHLMGDLDLVNLAFKLAPTIVEVYPPAIPVIEVLKKLETLCAKLLLKISTGPTFGIDFPVHVSLKNIKAIGATETVEYDVVEVGGGHVRAVSGFPGLQEPLDKLGFEFEHHPGVDLALGWFAGIRFLKVFAYSKHWTFDVLDSLGIIAGPGPYHNTVEVEPGYLPEPYPNARVEVVLDPPGSAA